MSIVKERLLLAYGDASISQLDGITIYYPEWKVTVRGSNTEPVIRVNVEYKGIDKVMEKLDEVKNVIGI